MAFITKYEVNSTKEQMLYSLKNIPQEIKIPKVHHFTIGDFFTSSKDDGYIYGKIAVKRSFDDFLFSIDEEFEIDKKPNEAFLYDEVTFIIFPDLKIISFASKDKAKLFGIEILRNVLFGDNGKIGFVLFNPQKVLEAKQKGIFQNVWFNGVRFEGNIQYSGQFGHEIDDDNEFENNPENRVGIGVEFVSSFGQTLKIAVYLEGTLLCKTKMKEFKDTLILSKEIIKTFLPYSNYNDKIPEKMSDQLKTLTDWM